MTQCNISSMVLVVYQWLNNLMRLHQWKIMQRNLKKIKKTKEIPSRNLWKQPLQEKDPDGFDEEHGDGRMKTFLEYSSVKVTDGAH